MKYVYFVTKEVEQELQPLMRVPEIAGVKEKCIASDKAIDKYGGTSSLRSNLWLMRKGNYRLVWQEEKHGDYTIYILREFYERHDIYEKEINSPNLERWCQRHQLSAFERTEVDNFAKSLNGPQIRPELPEYLYKYEKTPRPFAEHQDMIVFELKDWADGFSKVRPEDLRELQKAVSKIVMNPTNLGNNADEDVNKNLIQNNYYFVYTLLDKYKIVYRIGSFHEGNHTTEALYLLYLGESTDNLLDILDAKGYNLGDVNVLRHKSVKCYPYYYTDYYDFWIGIEKDSQANLALSQEELEILQNIEYPFFVSGLAGSGKSTILYYLYAHIYDYIVRNNKKLNAIFLSYSTKLVNNARNNVEAMLCHNSAFADSWRDYFKDVKNKQHFDANFMPFQEFVKSVFFTNDDYNKFSKQKHIDYERFKVLYEKDCQMPEKRNYSADIVWSVIRTFIKGRDSKKYFTSEDYNNPKFSSREQTVTVDDYKKIYKLFNNWYSHYFENDSGWDDLDLVRYALQSPNAEKHFNTYSVIFCDEAQDFTKIEIDLTLKLSEYTKYDLTTSDVKIPIAFAGDPNQTISPTGFRWGSVQEIYNEIAKEALGNYGQLAPNGLKMNYRSREAIMKLSNTIQCIRRKMFFKGQTLDLQEAWDKDDISNEAENYVAFYSLDKGENKDVLLSGLNKSIVITADEGEYIVGEDENGDEYTNRRKEQLGLTNIVDTNRLYTAITSKGLEFPSVILYRFSSDKAINSFKRLLNGEEISDSELYSISHFFTKLYIAMSRARRVLYILDTDESYEDFWKYFIDQQAWTELKNIIDGNAVAENIGKIVVGTINEYLLRLDENYNAREYADSLYKNAKDEKNVEIMNRARTAYLEARMQREARKCLAYSYLYNGKYKEAGQEFMELSMIKEAVLSYWEGQLWHNILETQDKLTSIDDSIRFRLLVARYMSKQDKNVNAAFNFIKKLLSDEYLDEMLVSKNNERELWTTAVLPQIEREISRMQPSDISNVMLQEYENFFGYFDWYKNCLKSVLAELYFKKADFDNRSIRHKTRLNIKNKEIYEKARDLWEADNKTTEKNYYRTEQYLSATDSDEIYWLNKQGNADEIITRFGAKEHAETLSFEARGLVFDSLLVRNFDAAIEYPYQGDKHDKWNRLYNANSQKFLFYLVQDNKNFDIDSVYFLSDKLKNEYNDNMFATLPADMFEKIFMLNGMTSERKPYWTYFISELKDINGNSVMKYADNRLNVLSALNKVISNSKNESNFYLSLFVELLFDKEYSYQRVENPEYYQQFNMILSKNRLFSPDRFPAEIRRNDFYRDIDKMTTSEFGIIKDNIQQFANVRLLQKVRGRVSNDVESLCDLYEMFVKYDPNKQEYDYASISSWYVNLQRSKSMSNFLNILRRRHLYFDFLQDNNADRYEAELRKLNLSLKSATEKLSKGKVILLICALNNANAKYSYERIALVAELIYKLRIDNYDLREYDKEGYIRENIFEMIKLAMSEKDIEKLDFSYKAKLFAYSIQVIFEDNDDAVDKLEQLLEIKSIAKNRELSDFIKRRALYLVSRRKNLYVQKQKQYGLLLDKIPGENPMIEKKQEKTIKGGAQNPKPEPAPNPIVEAAINMGKKLIDSGIALETVLSALPLSNPNDIQIAKVVLETYAKNK